MAIQMIALKPHRYAGKALRPGDEFFVGGNTQARLLTALGRAAICPPLAPDPAPAKSPRQRKKPAEDAAPDAPEPTPAAPESESPDPAEAPAQPAQSDLL